MFGCCRNEVELVGISVSDGSINDCAWLRILELADITTDESRIDSLAHVDVHELSGKTKARYRCLDLIDLWLANSGNLALTNAVTIEDEPGWVGASVGSLESLQGFDHSRLQRSCCLSSNLPLNHTGREVLGGGIVHRSGEGKD